MASAIDMSLIINILAGAVIGVGVGFLGAKAFMILQQWYIRKNARERIMKQDLTYVLDGKPYDLKKVIKSQEKGVPIPVKK